MRPDTLSYVSENARVTPLPNRPWPLVSTPFVELSVRLYVWPLPPCAARAVKAEDAKVESNAACVLPVNTAAACAAAGTRTAVTFCALNLTICSKRLGWTKPSIAHDAKQPSQNATIVANCFRRRIASRHKPFAMPRERKIAQLGLEKRPNTFSATGELIFHLTGAESCACICPSGSHCAARTSASVTSLRRTPMAR